MTFDILVSLFHNCRDECRAYCRDLRSDFSKTQNKKDSTLAYALHNMSIGHYRHIPILERGIPIGVVSLRDIIPYLAGK